MKKLPLKIVVLISLILLAGCQNSEFAIKEKCSKFLETAEVRYKGGKFEGTFYSKSKETCVSIYEYYGDTSSSFDIYDELTGQFLGNMVSSEDANKLKSSLNLLK